MTHLVGSNDVLLKQVNHRLNWLYSPPTPLLQAKGLTPSVLQQELNIINEKANKVAPGVCCWLFSRLLFTGLMVSAIIIALSVYTSTPFEADTIPIYLPIPIYLSVGVSICIMFGVAIRRQYKAKSGWAALRQYIEIELNEKYQSSQGIRWTISEDKFVYKHGSQVSGVYYHILIQAVDVIQPQQHVIQMDYNQPENQVDGVQYAMQNTYR